VYAELALGWASISFVNLFFAVLVSSASHALDNRLLSSLLLGKSLACSSGASALLLWRFLPFGSVFIHIRQGPYPLTYDFTRYPLATIAPFRCVSVWALPHFGVIRCRHCPISVCVLPRLGALPQRQEARRVPTAGAQATGRALHLPLPH
jgi:hypothetical protein